MKSKFAAFSLLTAVVLAAVCFYQSMDMMQSRTIAIVEQLPVRPTPDAAIWSDGGSENVRNAEGG